MISFKTTKQTLLIINFRIWLFLLLEFSNIVWIPKQKNAPKYRIYRVWRVITRCFWWLPAPNKEWEMSTGDRHHPSHTNTCYVGHTTFFDIFVAVECCIIIQKNEVIVLFSDRHLQPHIHILTHIHIKIHLLNSSYPICPYFPWRGVESTPLRQFFRML